LRPGAQNRGSGRAQRRRRRRLCSNQAVAPVVIPTSSMEAAVPGLRQRRLFVGEGRGACASPSGRRDPVGRRGAACRRDSQEPWAAIEWLWHAIDAASTPAELYGRALVVVAAPQYAARMVLPASQRTYTMHWGSHKDIAAKALNKLVGSHLPRSLRALARAVARVHAGHGSATDQDPAAGPVLGKTAPRKSTVLTATRTPGRMTPASRGRLGDLGARGCAVREPAG
jgi:hypothetical protein